MPSQKILEQKQAQVAALTEILKNSVTGVVVNYQGITVEDDTKLRKSLREAGCTYRVVKNTLLSRALKDAGIEGLDPVLEGTTAIATNEHDYAAGAKILTEYAKKSQTFQVKAGFIDGEAVDAAAVTNLAELPSKEVLIAQVLGGFNAPIQGLANVLNGTIRGLAIALNAICEQKAAQG